MCLDALDSLTSVGPDLDLTIISASVTPALFVEADAREKGSRILTAHYTWLLQSLGDISWVPEANLFWCYRGETEIVSALRPGHIEDFVR